MLDRRVTAPSRSCTAAEVTQRPRIIPKVSTRMVAFASGDLLASVIPNRLAALLGSLDALTVQNGGCRGGFAALPLAHGLAQSAIDPFPDAGFAPCSEVTEDRGSWGEVTGQHSPLAAASVQIEDSVENHSARVFWRSSSRFRWGNLARNDAPFSVIQITRVTLGCVHPKLDVELP